MLTCKFARFLLLSFGLGIGVEVARAGQQTPQALQPQPQPRLPEEFPTRASASRGPPPHSQVHTSIRLHTQPPPGTGLAVDEAFISYAFEFWLYPPFAGNLSHPNTFSNNLLNNIGALQGTKPRIRIGGNSGDYALYNRSQTTPVISRPVDTNYTLGVTKVSYYGDAFFETFQTLPDVKYVYQFNLAFVIGNPAGSQLGLQSLYDTVPLICKALAPSRLLHWEYGNEPDLYNEYSHSYIDGANWTNADYVAAWKHGVAIIRDRLRQTPGCTDQASDAKFKFMGPSLWLPAPNDTITLDGSWNAGLSQTGLIKELAMHRYLQNTKGNITYANTLLNHTHAITSLRNTLAPYRKITGPRPRLVISETASLSNIGIQNFTDTFAAALWNMDWALHLASQSISRVHFQQGVGFFYNSWESANTVNATRGTKAPYYGNLAAAYAIGESSRSRVRVYEHNLTDSPVDVAYSIYSDGVLKRLAILNLRTYFNGTRGTRTYTFDVPFGVRSGTIKRLVGPSSDNRGGVQWDGNMYSLLPNNGLPSSPCNVTTGETFFVRSGQVSVKLDDSSAAVLQFT